MTKATTRWAFILLLVGVGNLKVIAEPTAPSQVAPAGSGGGSDSAPADPVPAWVKNLKISGDLLYRYEQVDDDTASDEVERHRIRARLAVTGKVNDHAKYTFGLASGSSSAAYSTQQNLEDAWSKKSVWLDLAYFDYAAPAVKGLNI